MDKEDILEIAIKQLTKTLDDFIGSCLDLNGKPQSPNKKDIFRARGCLPVWCNNTLVKPKIDNNQETK